MYGNNLSENWQAGSESRGGVKNGTSKATRDSGSTVALAGTSDTEEKQAAGAASAR